MTSVQLKKMFENSQIHSQHQEVVRCSNQIQYLDLELENFKKHDYNLMNQSNILYNLIDPQKTQALIKTVHR